MSRLNDPDYEDYLADKADNDRKELLCEGYGPLIKAYGITRALSAMKSDRRAGNPTPTEAAIILSQQ